MKIEFLLKNKDGTYKKKDWFAAVVLNVLVIMLAVIFAQENKVSTVKSIGFGLFFLVLILIFFTFTKVILDLDQYKARVVNANANAITLFATYSALIDYTLKHLSFSKALFVSAGGGFVGAVAISALSSVITDVLKPGPSTPAISQNGDCKSHQVEVSPDSKLFAIGLAMVTAAIAIALSTHVLVIVILMTIPALFTVFRIFFPTRTNL